MFDYMEQEIMEQEIKVIDVDVLDLEIRLGSLGAIKVFDADRVFTYFDYRDGLLHKRGEEVRLTEEDKYTVPNKLDTRVRYKIYGQKYQTATQCRV